MALSTFSKFYFLDSITSDNQNMNFDEGGGELLGQVNIGSFTLTNILTAVKTALDVAGGQEYTVTVDRDTRKITISAGSNFSLLLSSGSQTGTSPWILLGFTQSVDLTGSASYTGSSAAGDVYITQFPPQDYVDSENNKQRIDASVNESASGVIEVISFGIRSRIEMNLMFITDKEQDGVTLRNNPTGLSDAQVFMQFITDRFLLEFMENKDDSAAFSSVQLEKTASDSKGVGYLLKEETSKNLPGYYSTGKLVFRVV